MVTMVTEEEAPLPLPEMLEKGSEAQRSWPGRA